MKIKSKRLFSYIFALILLVLLISACSRNGLVGTWKTKVLGINQIITFNADGTVHGAMLGFSSQLPVKYSVSGDKITMTMDTAQYGGQGGNSSTSTFILKGDTLYLDGMEFTRIE